MTSTPVPWLPSAALTAPEVLSQIDGALDAWSERWFRSLRVLRRSVTLDAGPASGDAAAATPRLSVRASASGLAILTGRALDLEIGQLEMSEADHSVVDDVSRALMQDLANALDEALAGSASGGAPGASSATGVVIELGDEDGRRLALVETSAALLASARRDRLGERAASAASLSPLSAALASTPVTLSAHLGSASIELPEARRLAAGDVVVLDRALDAPIDLVSDAGARPVLRAVIADTTPPLTLRLEPAPNRVSR